MSLYYKYPGQKNWSYGIGARVYPFRPSQRNFVCFFHFVGWDCISLGAHVCLGLPNIELHIPFGFIRIGWQYR